MTYKISQLAQADLVDIWVYIAQNNQPAADTLIDEITHRLQLLAQFPEMGLNRDELLSGLRSLRVKRYILFYTLTEDGIELFRVLHSSRDIESEFGEREQG